jgi:hypothetical protein
MRIRFPLALTAGVVLFVFVLILAWIPIAWTTFDTKSTMLISYTIMLCTSFLLIAFSMEAKQ